MEKEIKDWIQSDRDYNKGIGLLYKYGKKQLANNISGNAKRYSGKLLYHLSRLAGYTLVDFEELKKGSKIVPTNDKSGRKKTRSGPKRSQSGTKGKKDSQLPSQVRRIIHELNELYNSRALLHKELTGIPEENNAENIEKRKEIIDQIKKISDKYEVLYTAKDAYFSKKVLPDLKKLFPEYKTGIAKNEKLEGADMMKRKKNLESSLSKDRNLLKFQDKKKLEIENPMPEGPRKKVIEKRIADKVKELDEINQLLKNDA